MDLPGYGYAKVLKAELEKSGKMVERYLHGSKKLVLVFLLVDIRHEPSANDKMMYEWICHNGFRPVIIATKADKIKRSQLSKQIKTIRTGLKMQAEDVLMTFSSLSKQGRDEILDYIETALSDGV